MRRLSSISYPSTGRNDHNIKSYSYTHRKKLRYLSTLPQPHTDPVVYPPSSSSLATALHHVCWLNPTHISNYIYIYNDARLQHHYTILINAFTVYYIYLKKTSLSIIILRNPPFFIISLDYTPFLLVPSPLTDGPGQRGSGSPVAASTGDVQPELPKMGGVGPWKSTKDEDSTTFNM